MNRFLGVNMECPGDSCEPHRHAFTESDWKAALDFVDWQLWGMLFNRRFDRFSPQAVP